MRRKFTFGKVSAQNSRKINLVEVEIALEDKGEGKPEFTASATVWNSRHTDCIMGGQCLDSIWENYADQLENKELFEEILTLWNKYHLNGMKAWCEHNNYGEGCHALVKVHHLRGNLEYEALIDKRELPERYLEVTEEGLKNVPTALYEYSTLYGKTGVEEKDRGWIRYDEKYAPEGMIGKVCPVCGKKYGHSWYYMPIPQNDLDRIEELLTL